MMRTQDTIKDYIVTEFLPGAVATDLTSDYDLLTNGVIDSLGLLKLIAWVETEFDVTVDEAALDPDNFRSVDAIDALVNRPAPVRTN